MRITVLTGSVPNTTFVDAMINTMASEGYDMTVIGKRTGDYKYAKNVQVIELPGTRWGNVLLIIWLLISTGFRHLKRIMKESKDLASLYSNLLFYLPIISSDPDKIHVQWAAFIHNRDLLFDLYPDSILVSMRGAHINYTPITMPEIRESYLRLFPRVHRFHAVSNAIKEEAVQYGAMPDKTDVIYSYVDEDLLSKVIIPKEQKQELQIVSVGRFFWKKGYEYAIDALCRLKKSGVKFKYVLVAQGKTPASIIYQLHQCGLNEEVVIVNDAAHTEALRYIQEADVLLLPSVEEGIANVVLEAMALGTLVVTTDVGGMRETIEDGVNGFVVKVRDTQGITDALQKVSNLDKNTRFEMAQKAKASLRNKHDKTTFTECFRTFYNN